MTNQKMKKSKIFEIAIYTVLIFVALLLTWFLVPTQNGPKLFVVLSGSMQPAIRTGSVVVAKQADQYKVGDVVTFGKNTVKEIPTTHRIVEQKDISGVSVFITKGDANNAPDGEPVRKETIQGRVLFSVPYVGYLLSAAKSKQGLLILIIVGAIVIYSELMRIQKEVRNLTQKKKETAINKEKDEKTPV